MPEQTPDPKVDDNADPKTDATDPAPEAKTEKPAPRGKADKPEPKRYAAYDKSHGRYVGGVKDTKREAEIHAKLIREAGHTAEIREF